MAKYVIFDCDGTLIDSEILANQVEVDLKTELGFPITLEEQLRRFVGLHISHPDSLAELRRLPPDYRAKVVERSAVVYREKLRTIHGTIEALEALKLPHCVASSSEEEVLEMKLELTGLKKYFMNASFHGDLVEKCKPAPDLFFHAVKVMGWTASDCLVVEDSVPGVMAGRAAGMTVCGFLGGGHVLPGHGERLKKAGADFLVSDLREIQF